MVTPAHIVPEWYLLPFYAILRSVPDKLLGVIAMFASIFVLVILPWLDTSKIRSAVFRPLYSGLNTADLIFEVSNHGKITKTKIDANIAITPNNLSGTDLRIA